MLDIFFGGGGGGGLYRKTCKCWMLFMQKINARQSKGTYLVIGNLGFFRNLVIVGW